jgi:hypothetical protein
MQGPQTPLTRAMQYRQGLATLRSYCQSRFNGSVFASLPDDQKDQTLKDLEDGSIKLEGIDSKLFFTAMLIDTQQGFLMQAWTSSLSSAARGVTPPPTFRRPTRRTSCATGCAMSCSSAPRRRR